MNADESTDIRAFLAHLHRMASDRALRPIEEQRNEAGRALVEALADSDSEQPPYWTAPQCADVLQLLCSVAPWPGQCYCKDDSTIWGYTEVMNHLHESMMMVSALLAAQDADGPLRKPRPHLVLIDNTRGAPGDQG